MDDDRNRDLEEPLSPIIPTRPRGRRPKEPVSRSTRLRVSNESLHPQRDAEFPTRVEESNEIAQPEPTNETSLFDELVNKKTVNINKIVYDWIESYETNKEKAFLKIIRLILNMSGLKGTVTPEIMKMKNCNLVLKMPTDIETAKGIYPTIRKGSLIWKSFNTNYVNFIQTLIKSCKDSIVYDGYFMTNLFSCLNVLKRCVWQPLRHSAMLTALKLTSPLIDMVLEMKQNILEQQYNDPENEIAAKCSKIIEMIKIVVDGVLPLSYRDHFVVIRILTIAELHIWMQKYPEFFVNDDNIYYIRIHLNDKLFEVRTESIQVLQWLYECPEHRSLLTKLTKIIYPQIGKMLSDKKPEMVMQIINLIKTMVHHKYIAPNNSAIEYIHTLVYSVNQDIGRSAGEFLVMEIASKLNSVEPIETLQKQYLISLVDFSIDMKLENWNSILVDSLINSEFLKNWESYIDLLLLDNSVNESQDRYKKLVLVDLMVYCVEQVSTGISPAPRDPDSVLKKTYVENWKESKDRRDMTKVFVKKLTTLINKFLPHMSEIRRLVEIPKYFDSAELSSNFVHVKEDIMSLIAIYVTVYENSMESKIMHNNIRALAKFSEVNSSFQDECATLQSNMIQICLERFSQIAFEHHEDMTSSRNEASQNSRSKKDIISSLLILSLFFENQDLNNVEGIEQMGLYIDVCSRESTYILYTPYMALVYALRCSYYSLIWRVTETFNLDPSDRHEHLLNLQQLFEKSIAIYESVVLDCSRSTPRVEAFYLLCNSLMFRWKCFSQNTTNPNSDPSMYKPTLNTCDTLSVFIQSTVFAIVDEQTEEQLKIKQTLLMYFCKLIVNGIVSRKRAVDIIQHYNIWSSEYGDIIKNMIIAMLDRNKNNAFTVTSICLRKLFLCIKERHGRVDTGGDHYFQVKNLANNFASMLPSNKSTRECILKMHRKAIAFSFDGWNHSDNENRDASGVLSPPPNIQFLGIFIDFVKKLNRNDKQHIEKFLYQYVQVHDLINLKGNEWLSFTKYRAQIRH